MDNTGQLRFDPKVGVRCPQCEGHGYIPIQCGPDDVDMDICDTCEGDKVVGLHGMNQA